MISKITSISSKVKSQLKSGYIEVARGITNAFLSNIGDIKELNRRLKDVEQYLDGPAALQRSAKDAASIINNAAFNKNTFDGMFSKINFLEKQITILSNKEKRGTLFEVGRTGLKHFTVDSWEKYSNILYKKVHEEMRNVYLVINARVTDIKEINKRLDKIEKSSKEFDKSRKASRKPVTKKTSKCSTK